MKQLKNADGSLVEMILRGTVSRPHTLSPAPQRHVAWFWERDPLAIPKQCHQWLTTQPLPPGTELPTVEHLAKLTRLRGNLVTVRHAVGRLFASATESPTLWHDTLVSRLFEVIDAQDRALEELKGIPIQRPGLVHVIAS